MDYDKLRGDLRDYYGTAMFNGNPMAMMELEEVERASNEELARIARDNAFDLSKYEDSPSYAGSGGGYGGGFADASSGAGIGVSVRTELISPAATRFFEKDEQPQPQEVRVEFVANQQADDMMNKALEELEDRLRDAERDFEWGQKMMDIKTSYSISDVSQLADIVSEANRITEELYANYESLVRAANSICKPFADQGVHPETLTRIVKFLEHINAECSTLGSNFSASVNSMSLGGVAATRYSPTSEARMIETNWRLLHSMHPDVENEAKRVEEKKRLEREAREEKRRAEKAKAIEEYPAKLAEWEKKNAEAEVAREKWLAEARVSEEKRLREKIEKNYRDALARAEEQAAEGGRLKRDAQARIKSATFLQFSIKLQANEDTLRATEMIAKANEIAKSAREDYNSAIANFDADFERAMERKQRELDSEIPLPRKPRDPNVETNEPDWDSMTSVQRANIEIKEEILETLRSHGSKMTLTDVMDWCDAASGLSNQRVSALLRQLVTDGSVIRTEEARKAYFEAAD